MSNALDRLAPPSDLGPLEGQPVAELRARRNQLQGFEQALSYVRRLVQGRLDIVLDERSRRAEGAGSRDLSSLVDDLPKILAEHSAGSGRGALPEVGPPPEDIDDVLGELDHVIDAGGLGNLAQLDDAGLAAVIDGLSALEHDISHRRRALHAAIDEVQAEIVRRYKTGEASVDALIP